MSTHLPGFQSFFSFLHHFVLPKVATSRKRVKVVTDLCDVVAGGEEVLHQWFDAWLDCATVKLRETKLQDVLELVGHACQVL